MSRLAYCTLLEQNKHCVISGFTRLMPRQIFLDLPQGINLYNKKLLKKANYFKYMYTYKFTS